jgi:hypothetical protein
LASSRPIRDDRARDRDDYGRDGGRQLAASVARIAARDPNTVLSMNNGLDALLHINGILWLDCR